MYDHWVPQLPKQMVYFCLFYDSLTWWRCQRIKKYDNPIPPSVPLCRLPLFMVKCILWSSNAAFN